MTERKATAVLLDLVDVGFEILMKPHRSGCADRLIALSDEIERMIDAKPSHARFLRRGARDLVSALGHLCFYRDCQDSVLVPLWEAICGSLCATVRHEAREALTFESEVLRERPTR